MQSNPVHFPVFFPGGDTSSIIKFGNATGGILANTSFYNPYADMVSGYTQSFYSTVLSTIRLNQKLDFITKGLSANVLASFKNYSYSSISRSYTPYYYQLASYGYDSTNKKYNYNLSLLGNGGSTSLGQSGGSAGDRTLYLQALLNYDRTFGGKHAVSGLLVFQQKEYDINNPGADITGSLPHRNLGLSGRATYSYDNRYFVEGNFGYTGSENFAAGHRYGFFPSVGVGYVISNENYFSSLSKVFTLLKVRASYGLAGNDQIASGNRFPYLSNVNLNAGNGFTFGQTFNNSRNGVSITQYANPDITWEIAHKANIGLDVQILHQLTLNIDFFQEKRDHIFQQRTTIPSTVGTGSAPLYANIAKVQNSGVDISAVYNHVIRKDFVISGRGTFTFARNKYLYLDQPNYIYPYLSAIGRPVNTLRGLVADRLFIDATDIAKNPTQQFGTVNPGDIKYVNQTGAYTSSTAYSINSNDKVAMGHPYVPEITYGFGLNTVYKKWDAGIFFQGVASTSFFMNGIDPFNGSGGINQRNLFQFIADNHWSPTNQNLHALYPRLSEVYNINNGQNSSWWLRNGSFIRLKNVEIGYSPTKEARIYVNGTNLLTFSAFKLWDPEIAANSYNNNGQGYPPQRVLNVGVQINLK
jgi:TonB-linked SusC/RagA family outer membrane protein